MPATINLGRAHLLMSKGFVHITGLETFRLGFLMGEDNEVIQASLSHCGKWDTNNGLMVAITEDGEVWLRAGYLSREASTEIGLFRICPEGKGAFVPCSNGEHILGHWLLKRIADPYSDCDGHASAEPRPQ